MSGFSRTTRRVWLLTAVALAATAPIGAPHSAEPSEARPQVTADGVAHVPAMTVPPSNFMSAEARKRFIQLFSNPEPPPPSDADIREVREFDERKKG